MRMNTILQPSSVLLPAPCLQVIYATVLTLQLCLLLTWVVVALPSPTPLAAATHSLLPRKAVPLDTTGHTLIILITFLNSISYSFGHELGHNFGAYHNVEQYSSSSLSSHPYSYGHGYLIKVRITSSLMSLLYLRLFSAFMLSSFITFLWPHYETVLMVILPSSAQAQAQAQLGAEIALFSQLWGTTLHPTTPYTLHPE